MVIKKSMLDYFLHTPKSGGTPSLYFDESKPYLFGTDLSLSNVIKQELYNI